MDVDDAQVQALYCFAASFRHPATNEPQNGILRVNAQNQSVELFTMEGLLLSVSSSNMICFQFDVRNPETAFTIYRRAQLPVDIQTATSDDSDLICVLLDALNANRPIASNSKFLRSGQADLNGMTVTLILLGNAHIIFAKGSSPILLINLAHTKIILNQKTAITLTLLKGAEHKYLLEMKSERERQEWVVAFNRAMAIRKTPAARQAIAEKTALSSAPLTTPLAHQPIVLMANSMQAKDSGGRQEQPESSTMQRRSAAPKHNRKLSDVQHQKTMTLSEPQIEERESFNDLDGFNDDVRRQEQPESSTMQRWSIAVEAQKQKNFDVNDGTPNGLQHQNSITMTKPQKQKRATFSGLDGQKRFGVKQRQSLVPANNPNSSSQKDEKTAHLERQSVTTANHPHSVGQNNEQAMESIPIESKPVSFALPKRDGDSPPSKVAMPTIRRRESSRKNIEIEPEPERTVSIAVPDTQKREILSKNTEMEPEPEPLRSPSFSSPVLVQVKSIRSSYAVARSLVSATSMKYAPSPDLESMPSNEKEAEPETKKEQDELRIKSAMPSEHLAKEPVEKTETVACVAVSIEKEGMLRPLTSTANIIHLTARCAEAAAITIDGSILQWSFSDDGVATGPVIIPRPEGVAFSALSCGRDHHLAISSPPAIQLYGWGRCSLLGMKGPLKTVTSTTLVPALANAQIKTVASAAKHTLAVSTQDEIWSWGGEGPWLGRDQARHHFTPSMIRTRLPAAVQQVACSTESSYIVTVSGCVYACGTGRHGRLGLGDTQDRSELTAVQVPAEIVDLVAGGRHVLARSETGKVYAWGCNAHGQLGIQSAIQMATSPVLVPAFTNCGVVKIAAAKTATMALTRSAEVLLCGSLTGNHVVDSPTILELDPTVCGRVRDVVCGYNIGLIMSELPAKEV